MTTSNSLVGFAAVDKYLKDVQDITERLAALGAPVESDFQVAFILRGLPSEFDALRVALLCLFGGWVILNSVPVMLVVVLNK